MNIYIDKTTTGQLGTNIVNESGHILEGINKMNRVVSDIESAWEGADATQYVSNMRDAVLPALNQLQQLIDSYGKYLANVPNVYSTIDDSSSSKCVDE